MTRLSGYQGTRHMSPRLPGRRQTGAGTIAIYRLLICSLLGGVHYGAWFGSDFFA